MTIYVQIELCVFVFLQVPRLTIDLEIFVGYRVSAEEAKARCRELDRCGEGLTQQELCDACVSLMLQRESRPFEGVDSDDGGDDDDDSGNTTGVRDAVDEGQHGDKGVVGNSRESACAAVMPPSSASVLAPESPALESGPVFVKVALVCDDQSNGGDGGGDGHQGEDRVGEYLSFGAHPAAPSASHSGPAGPGSPKVSPKASPKASPTASPTASPEESQKASPEGSQKASPKTSPKSSQKNSPKVGGVLKWRGDPELGSAAGLGGGVGAAEGSVGVAVGLGRLRSKRRRLASCGMMIPESVIAKV